MGLFSKTPKRKRIRGLYNVYYKINQEGINSVIIQALSYEDAIDVCKRLYPYLKIICVNSISGLYPYEGQDENQEI